MTQSAYRVYITPNFTHECTIFTINFPNTGANGICPPSNGSNFRHNGKGRAERPLIALINRYFTHRGGKHGAPAAPRNARPSEYL